MNQPAKGSLFAGRYRLVEPASKGASAEVWLAHDLPLDRPVAAKISRGPTALDSRSPHDRALLASIEHPGLVKVLETVRVDNDFTVEILEWVDGTDLRSLLDAGPLPIEMVERLAHDLADALDALHGVGLVHRDVKPANIMIGSDGAAKLLDFGLVTTTGLGAAPTRNMVGTAKYMSPEQVRGHEVDARSDTYSLCVVLYEALTGIAPFTGESEFETAMARLTHNPADPRELMPAAPAHLIDLILQGLSVDPAHRWTHLPQPSASIHSSPSSPAVTIRRRIWPRLVGLAFAVGIAALGIVLVMSAARSLAG